MGCPMLVYGLSITGWSSNSPIVTCGRDDNWSVDSVWVHAALVIVVHADESPVGDNTSNADATLAIRASNQVLNRGSVEQLDVGELKNLAEKGAGEEGSVLDDDEVGVVTVILIWNTNFAQESIGWLPHDHSGEELTTEPSTTTWGNTSLNDGDLEVWTSLGQGVGGAETARAGTDDDDIRLGVLVEVIEVAAGHGTRDLRLTDGAEREIVPLASHGLDRVKVGSTLDRNGSAMRQGSSLAWDGHLLWWGGWLLEKHGWWRHVGCRLRCGFLTLLDSCCW